jgi:hypothetical protein
MNSESQWTPDAIRALGPTTDLPTLGDIVDCSRWKSYQMARQGEWEHLGIKALDRVKVSGRRPVDPGRPGIRLSRPRRPGSHTRA